MDSATVLKVRLSEDLRAKVEEHANQVGISMADVVRVALHNYLPPTEKPAEQKQQSEEIANAS